MTHSIRNYTKEDAQSIGAYNFMFKLAYQYNKDFLPENIFCAELNGQVVASGHLEPTDSCEYLDKKGKGSDYIHRFIFDLDSNDHPQLEIEIFNRILERSREIANAYPNKRIQIGHTCSHEDMETMDYLLEHRFYHSLSYLIMKRDLNEPLPTIHMRSDIEIKRWVMGTEAEKQQYLQAEKESSDGESWSLNKLNWFKAGSEWDTFTAFHNGDPVASCMTWGLSDERSATEQIFTHPKWRKQGIAKATIVETLKFLRDHKHKKVATLGVVGSNHAAINLYKSLGYQLFDIHMLMVKDIN